MTATGASTDVEQAKQALREEFGHRYSIIYSSAGRWWAFGRPMVREDADPRVDLDADTAELLAERLRKVTERLAR